MNLALGIRGHVRHALTNSALLEFVKKLRERHNVTVFCHSWANYEAEYSYRPLDKNKFKVTKNYILHYFNFEDIAIKISDETSENLIGDLSGCVASSTMPKIGWKRMWRGRARLMNLIDDGYDKIIDTRFDLFTLKAVKHASSLYFRLLDQRDRDLSLIYPSYTRNPMGVDNFIVGKPEIVKQLAFDFDSKLDEISNTFHKVKTQEELVYCYAKSKGWVS